MPSTSILSSPFFVVFDFVAFGASVVNSISRSFAPFHQHLPVIWTSPSCAIAFSTARCRAWFLAFSSFRAFFPDGGANGPLVGRRTLLGAVPRGFLVTLLTALRFWTLARLAIRRCLLGTFGLPREGIVVVAGDCCKRGLSECELENKIVQSQRGMANRSSDPRGPCSATPVSSVHKLASKANFFQHHEGHRKIVPGLSAAAFCSRSRLVHYLGNTSCVRIKTHRHHVVGR